MPAGGAPVGGGGPLVGPYAVAALGVTATYDATTTTITATGSGQQTNNKKYQYSYVSPGGSTTYTACKGPGSPAIDSDTFVLPAGFATGNWVVHLDEYNNGNSCQDNGSGTGNRQATANTGNIVVTAGSIAGTAANDFNGNGAVDAGDAGLAGATVTLFRDSNGNGVFNAGTDPQVGSPVTTTSTGAWSFGSLALAQTYFVVETNPANYTSTNAIVGTQTNATTTKVTNDQLTVVLNNVSGQNSSSTANQFLDTGLTTVAPNNASVTVNEGQTASNTGTYSDPDTGDNVSFSASVGTVTKTGTNAGTWSWSLATTDGPDQSATVTITADDGHAHARTTTFALAVNNVAPTVAFTAAPASANEGQTKTYTYSISDPGVDTVTSVATSCGANGTKSNASNTNTSGTFDCTFPDGPASSTVSAQATDSDGAAGNTASQS